MENQLGQLALQVMSCVADFAYFPISYLHFSFAFAQLLAGGYSLINIFLCQFPLQNENWRN